MLVYKSFEPKVSVILATFNRKELLPRAINSVLNQTCKNWELIIVDDGSYDNSFELIDDYIQHYENIRYVRHSNRKPPLSFNAGIRASVGKYISFLGSDDEYSESYLEERISYMNSNSDVWMIHGGLKIVGNPYVKDKNDLTKQIHISECIVGGTFFAKRELFFELDGFKNLPYSDDSDFYERAIPKYLIHKVDLAPYIYYRDTPDSICSTIEWIENTQ